MNRMSRITRQKLARGGNNPHLKVNCDRMESLKRMNFSERKAEHSKEELEENAEKILRDSNVPVVLTRNERRVETGFWTKLKRFARKIPFAEDLVAAYYCATDTATPVKVRGVLMAALAYFVLPIDFIPDFILGFGFSDDATVLATAIALVSSHIKPEHRQRAQHALADSEDDKTDSSAAA